MGLMTWLASLLVPGLSYLERGRSASVRGKLRGTRLALFVPAPPPSFSQKSRGTVRSNFLPRRHWAVITGRGEKQIKAMDACHQTPPHTHRHTHRTKSLAKNDLAEDWGGGSGSTVFAVQTSGPQDRQHPHKKLNNGPEHLYLEHGVEGYREKSEQMWSSLAKQTVGRGYLQSQQRPHLKGQGREQLRRHPGVALWPPSVHTNTHTSLHCSHRHGQSGSPCEACQG